MNIGDLVLLEERVLEVVSMVDEVKIELDEVRAEIAATAKMAGRVDDRVGDIEMDLDWHRAGG